MIDSGLTDEQIVGELFKNFTEDPAFLSSPESDFEFVPPPPSSSNLPMSSTALQEESYGVVPLSSGPSPPPNQDLYPRLNKKPRNTPDIERWTPYNPPVRQYFALYDARSEEMYVSPSFPFIILYFPHFAFIIWLNEMQREHY
jgi:hypothetical protein